MEKIQTQISVKDDASKKFLDIMKAADSASRSVDKFRMSVSGSYGAGGLSSVNSMFSSITSKSANMMSSLNGNTSSLKNLVQASGSATVSLKSLATVIGGVFTAKWLKQATQSLIQASDNWTNTVARFKMIDGVGKNVSGMIDNVYASAQRARIPLNEMAGIISKLGLLAGDKFADMGEVSLFAETLAKSLKISGATGMETASAMHQITQAMASGRLQGDELRSILENAPMYARALREEMGNIDFKKAAAEGQITSDVMRRAMLRMAQDVNQKMKELPLTFETVMGRIKNAAYKGFAPVLEAINGIWNTEAFKTGLNFLENAFLMLGQVMSQVILVIGDVFNFIFKVLDSLKPLIIGLIVAFVLYKGAVLGVAVAQGIASLATLAYTGIVAMLNGTLSFATIAQNLFNSALLACPITWIVLGIAMFVAMLIQAVKSTMRLGTVTEAVFAVIGMMIAGACNMFAFLANVGLAAAEFIMNAFIQMGDAVNKVTMSIEDFFIMMGASVSAAASDIGTNIANAFIFGANIAIKAINGLINAMNKIPGINIGKASELAYRSSKAPQIINSAANRIKQRNQKRESEKMGKISLGRFEYKDIDAEAQRWAGKGKAMHDKLFGDNNDEGDDPSDKMYKYMKGIEDKLKNNENNAPGGGGSRGGGKSPSSKMLKPVKDIEKNTKEVAENTQNQKLDVRYLRELAERQAINRVTTTVVNVESNIKHIQSDIDLDGYGDSLAKKISERVNNSTSLAYVK